MRTFFLLAGLVALAGCSNSVPPPPTAATQKLTQEHAHDENHDHNAGQMMTGHFGKYHAKLTVHLSAKDGNELDIFVETIDDAPTPVALPLLTITGTARRDGEEFPLTFEPAPADERPKGEAAGSCSHFVAKAAFLKPTDTLTVVIKAEFDGRERKCTWKNFEVAKFTHHAD